MGAGGVMAVLSSAYLIKCDTRIHSALTCTANTAAPATANHHITVTLGDGTTHAKSNILQGSLVIGSTSTAVTGTVAAFCIANAATGSTATTRRNVAASCKDTDKDGDPKIDKVILDCDCGGGAVAVTACNLLANRGDKTKADLYVAFPKTDVNSFYHVVGFYDTGTAKVFVDALHEGVNNKEVLQSSQGVSIMGARSGTNNYPYRAHAGVNEIQLYVDLQSYGAQGGGLGRKDRAIAPTASVVAGRGLKNHDGTAFPGTQVLSQFFTEHAEKYQYAGRGFDQLTVTPTPDSMSDQKVVITYNGAAGACSVAEVDRGTHESSVCSGRGNCDHASGTCVCDLGYTLEACSEQTVLV